MRRATVLGLALVTLAAGCGGGSDKSAGPSGNQPAAKAPAAALEPQVTDGRLGEASLARPGHTEVTGRTRRIPARTALPPSNKHALGAEDNCPDVEIQPTPDNLPHLSDVIFCLMNAMRQNNGLPALSQESALAKASLLHSEDMIKNKFFAHDSLDGRDVVARLTPSYIPSSGEWVVGENLAWGAGALGSPRALVNAWMNSPPHRENLLSGDFKEVGMGIAFGTPSKEADNGVTVTTDFGTKLGSGPAAASASRNAGASRRARSRCNRRRGAARRRCLRAARRG